jgi:1-aminocyclopropane-1-carboxylate deaminase
LSSYGKISTEVLEFISQWYDQTNIPLEPIYSGKLFFYINNKIKSKQWSKNAKLLAVHTGGMQGIRRQQNIFTEYGYYDLWKRLRENYQSSIQK